ncbi:MAG: hypothetical protein Q4P71_06760 [Actinomycetaceae bacterium]|nr:hypothetical protein [Actinomycetaceae bacterium]
MNIRHQLTKRLTVGASAIVLSFGLAACSAQPGTAVIVDDEEYSEDVVSQTARELTDLSGNPFTPTDVVNLLTINKSVIAVGEKNNITLSGEDVRNSFAEVNDNLSDSSVEVLKTIHVANLLSQNIDEMTFSTQLRENQENLSIEVNPRYGKLTEEKFLSRPILDGVFDPLVQPGN